MFDIDYILSRDDFDSTEIDDTTLRYNLFLGNIILKNDENSIMLDWSWIPLLDFAFSLRDISNNLYNKISIYEEFEFTESDAKLIFKNSHNNINISTSFSNEILHISLKSFHITISNFYKKLVFEIIYLYPRIKANASFLKYIDKMETI